jgi:hypothetical protein
VRLTLISPTTGLAPLALSPLKARRFGWGQVGFAALLALLVTGCFAQPAPQPTSVKWLVYGDSLSAEAQTYLTTYGTVGARFFAGTAPCSWVGDLGNDASTYAPRVVLMQFIGNIPSCMNGRDPQTAYTADLTTIANFWKARNVTVVMVISPKTPTDNLAWARQAEMNVAANLALPVNDAGQAVMLNGAFTYFLTCLPLETVTQGCGSEMANQIRVRHSDGVHFGTSNREGSYSSGAYRFATAEAQS